VALQHQKAVITRFAEAELGVGIDSWPDEVNRETKDIDALAGGGRFAIELTSLDSIPNQRRRDAQFEQVIQGLEAELSPIMQFRLVVSIHVSAIQTGQDWPKARESIKAWVLTESAGLAYGSHAGFQIPGLPFLANVDKLGNPWKPKLVFRRHGSEAEFQPDYDKVRALLEDKASKLRPYSASGKTTILLVESQDMALMSPQFFCEFAPGLFDGGRPSGVDQIWFADCSSPAELLFHRCP
jgi:hypothetical protein